MLTEIITPVIAGIILFILQILMKWYDQYSIMLGNIYKLRETNKDIEKNTEEIRDIISASGLPICMVNNLLNRALIINIAHDIDLYKYETKPKEQDKACSYGSIQRSFPSFVRLLVCFIKKLKVKNEKVLNSDT